MIELSNMKSNMFHLNMRLVVVVWTCELSLLPHSFSEQHNLQNECFEISGGINMRNNLLKEEDCHFPHFEVWPAGWVIGAEQRTSQQQLALCHDLALKRSI